LLYINYFNLWYLSTDAKSNGNVFGVALSQCVNDDDSHLQDDIPSTSANNRKYSADTIEIPGNETEISPSGSISSTNDSGRSISPANPSASHVKIKKINL